MLLLLLLFVYAFRHSKLLPIKQTTVAARAIAGAIAKTIKLREEKKLAQCATKTIIFEIKFIDSMNERMGVCVSLVLILSHSGSPIALEIQYSTHLSNILPSHSHHPAISCCHSILCVFAFNIFKLLWLQKAFSKSMEMMAVMVMVAYIFYAI